MKIYCIECADDVEARLTNGGEVYPHRKDLSIQGFWICDKCKNFVGTHYKSNTPTRPLGVIANQEVKNERIKIHAKLDPLWRSGVYDRKSLYRQISDMIGRPFHTSDVRSVEEAQEIYKIIPLLKNN
jgi:hypothetical protein